MLMALAVLFLLSANASAPQYDADTEYTVYYFEINDEIGPPTWRITKLAIEEAIAKGADIVFLKLNTYGGLVDAADSIRTKIMSSSVPVMVLIENNAASAGALISIACDSIFMMPGSTIGAATVVNAQGEQVPDKYQSYMRKKMRATAEENNRDPDIAEAMVDPDKEVEGISEKGKVLTFTTEEALKHGFCDAKVKSMEEALAYSGVENYTVIRQQHSWTDRLIGWLISPVISGILIMLIIGGIYFELQSPGLGFPSIAALVAVILYFAPLYIEGLAENWEILIFIVGLILIALEIFVIPGFGVAGISGMVLVLAGLVLALVRNVGFDFTPINSEALTTSILVVLISTGLSITGSIYLAMRLLKTNFFARFVLDAAQPADDGFVGTSTEEHELIGHKGEAVTVLRPSGKIKIGKEVYDATASIGYLEAGTKVVVEKYEAAQLFVLEDK